MTPTILVLLLLALNPLDGDAIRYDDVSMEFEGQLLDHRFVDLNGSGKSSLCLAVRLAGGGRELRLHRLGRHGFEPEPTHTVPVLEDVVAYGFADVREEEGKELLFLTRTGVWSFSLTKKGYRGNIRRLVEEELLYDVPDNRALPHWAYVIPARDGDQLLLPGRGTVGVWGPAPGGGDSDPREATYEKRSELPTSVGSPVDEPPRSIGRRRRGEGRVTREAGGGVRIETHRGGGLFLEDFGRSSTLLRDGKSYTAPALVDLDGDRDLDLILLRKSDVAVYLSASGVLPAKPSRVETLPDYLVTEEDLSLKLLDVDRDGDRDLLVQIAEDVQGFENAQIRVLVLINDGRRLLPDAPQQVLRFEAAIVRAQVVDVDADQRPDLVVRKFELPSMLETVTGLEFRLTSLVFFAGEKGASPFERKPGLKQTQVFDENTVADAVKNRRLELDCDGDDLPDLVEVDIQGRIAIRRLQHESGFFSGDSWEFEENPWKRFETRGSIRSIDVVDVNGDGLGDIVSPGARSLTLFLSSRVR